MPARTHEISKLADRYRNFKGMLDDDNPPEDFETLLREASRSPLRFEAGIAAAPGKRRGA